MSQDQQTSQKESSFWNALPARKKQQPSESKIMLKREKVNCAENRYLIAVRYETESPYPASRSSIGGDSQ